MHTALTLSRSPEIGSLGGRHGLAAISSRAPYDSSTSRSPHSLAGAPSLTSGVAGALRLGGVAGALPAGRVEDESLTRLTRLTRLMWRRSHCGDLVHLNVQIHNNMSMEPTTNFLCSVRLESGWSQSAGSPNAASQLTLLCHHR